jgi:hypothetical protein
MAELDHQSAIRARRILILTAQLGPTDTNKIQGCQPFSINLRNAGINNELNIF